MAEYMKEQRYVRVYTGNGQGKTTAAFGVVVRALCAGMKVYVGQFVKDEAYNEARLVEHFAALQVEQLGDGCFLFRDPCEHDREVALAALHKVTDLMHSGDYDIVVLDELCIALYYNLLTIDEVLQALNQRCAQTEVIITGRYAPQQLIDYADLVTEMLEVKHYYATDGVTSRNGFDH
ncbi:MAG: cob(I)yrinic acid a,c-diamide adenosyltransferase [Muribaculaceae bacterium]